MHVVLIACVLFQALLAHMPGGVAMEVHIIVSIAFLIGAIHLDAQDIVKTIKSK